MKCVRRAPRRRISNILLNIVHLIYQHKNYEGHARDYEFSGTSMREHSDSGYEDTLRTLRHPEWLERSAISRGVTVHDLHREDPT
jgi:NTE family protein